MRSTRSAEIDSLSSSCVFIEHVRLTSAFQPRRLRIAEAAVGCKRLLGGSRKPDGVSVLRHFRSRLKNLPPPVSLIAVDHRARSRTVDVRRIERAMLLLQAPNS